MTVPRDPWRRNKGDTGSSSVIWLGVGLCLVIVGALSMMAEKAGLL